MPALPAIALRSLPGRRATTIELAVQAERRGFGGVWAPSLGEEQLSACLSVLTATTDLVVGTAIHPIGLRRAEDLAATAAYLAEVSGGRFRLGLGLGHGPPPPPPPGEAGGGPLASVRAFVGELRARDGALPPVVLATLRDRMLALAGEVADGALWEHAARSHLAAQVAAVVPDRPAGFGLAAMVLAVVDDDRAAGAAACREALGGFARLESYRSYWSAAGYEEEMAAIADALEAGDEARVPGLMTDRWVDDVSVHGSAGEVRDGIEAWSATGVDTVIVIPVSTSSDDERAVGELFDCYAR